MPWSDRCAQFRAILAGTACIVPASVYDPISARLAADLGFECAMLGGSIAAHAVLGAPDRMLLTLTEFADLAARIARAAPIPLLVDADHGYGNALNVMRTVQSLEAAGVAALTIEDTELPRRHGAEGPALIPIIEGVGKMRAAIAARTDPALAIIARTSAPAITGPEDAAARLDAYAATGVDAVFIVGLKTRAALQALQSTIRLPIILAGAGGELADPAFLAGQGVRIALRGHAPYLAALRATQAALIAQRDGTAMPPLADDALLRRALRDEAWAEAERDYLGS
jgi:carboxyvinyl-carboxyphosphonate phosphorylmutase